ncbi:MAG: ABC transporter ATP-binding protein [Oscillospiraceae bacterium]|nr:ABC transporter ATP-binding protein [Oscillospiraceae bacterium]
MTVSANGISKSYTVNGKNGRTVTAVQPTDIDIECGKLTVILGRSGSGKTTFINILSGLIRPSEGKVLYDGKDIFKMPDEKSSIFRSRHIGYIPQGQSTIASLTVRENIMLPLAVSGKKDTQAEADRLIEILGLRGLRDAYPNELSGGELRRTVIARALVNSQEVIFADEPTNDLDDENTLLVLELLKNESRKGKTVVIVTHERTAEQYADAIFRMEKGNIEPLQSIYYFRS